MLQGSDKQYLYHNSTLALDGETGEIRWYYQHLIDHWDLDHPFERMLLDTAVAPDPEDVPWINPAIKPGETRKVMTGIPGKTALIYTLDRETGEFLWARPTVEQNVVADIDGKTGKVTGEPDSIPTEMGQTLNICPSMHGGKDWEAGAYSPLTNTMYFRTPQRLHADLDHDLARCFPFLLCALRRVRTLARQDGLGQRYAVSAQTGATTWLYEQRAVDDVGGRHGRWLAVPRRYRRRIHGPRPGKRQGAVAGGTRFAGDRVSDHLRRGRPAVRGGQHRVLGNDRELPPDDAGVETEFREQPLRIRVAGVITPSPTTSINHVNVARPVTSAWKNRRTALPEDGGPGPR